MRGRCRVAVDTVAVVCCCQPSRAMLRSLAPAVTVVPFACLRVRAASVPACSAYSPSRLGPALERHRCRRCPARASVLFAALRFKRVCSGGGSEKAWHELLADVRWHEAPSSVACLPCCISGSAGRVCSGMLSHTPTCVGSTRRGYCRSSHCCPTSSAHGSSSPCAPRRVQATSCAPFRQTSLRATRDDAAIPCPGHAAFASWATRRRMAQRHPRRGRLRFAP